MRRRRRRGGWEKPRFPRSEGKVRYHSHKGGGGAGNFVDKRNLMGKLEVESIFLRIIVLGLSL
jgi:hypothetical protein